MTMNNNPYQLWTELAMWWFRYQERIVKRHNNEAFVSLSSLQP